MDDRTRDIALALQACIEGPPGDFDKDRPAPAYVKAAIRLEQTELEVFGLSIIRHRLPERRS